MTDTGAIYNTAGQVIKLVTENPWEWGWDAWVSIGTLALAFVTVLLILSTVGVGVYAYRQAEKHHRQSLAGILSTHGRCKLVDSYEI